MTRVPGNFQNASCAVFDPSTIALLTVMSPQTADRQRLIDRTIRTLKALSLWDKLDVLCLVGADQTSSLLNWKQNGVGNATIVGSVPFTNNRKFAIPTATSTNYMDTQFNPSTFGGQFVQDSMSMMAWIPGPYTAQSVGRIGWTDGTDSAFISPSSTSTPTSFIWAGNVATANNSAATRPSISRLFHGNRSGSAALQFYVDGNPITISASTATSTALNNHNFLLGTHNGTNVFQTDMVSWAFGSSFAAADAVHFYQTIQYYLSQIGAA